VESIVVDKKVVKSKNIDKFKNRSFPIIMQMWADTISVTISFLLQYYFVFSSGILYKPGVPNYGIVALGLLFVNLYWFALFYFSGLYKNWYERSPFEEFFTIIKTTFIGILIIYILVITNTTKQPRLSFLFYFFNITFITIALRLVVRKIQKKLRSKGLISMSAVVIGTEAKINSIKSDTIISQSWGLNVIGGVLSQNHYPNSENIIGRIGDLEQIIDTYNPEVIIMADAEMNHKTMFQIVNLCSERNIRCKIEPDLYSIFTGQTKTHNIYGIPFIEISPQLMKNWEQTTKRMFDIIFSSVVLLLGFPFWLLVALAIRLESKGNIFYTQDRVGKDGKLFRMIKFRSMVPNADKIGGGWTEVNDKRVTKFGKLLRKTHLDEIPQFLNVIKGDMSIVGPRPEQPHLVEEFSKTYPFYKRRLKVRPGITGWWQVKYTPYTFDIKEIEGRLKDDFYYIENMSIKFDIEIVIRTVWCVIKGHGQA
jgi:exopolysaccharide biosynthesis polyprenyl glycosylphosphotransferase